MRNLVKLPVQAGAVYAALTLGVMNAEAVPLYSYTISSPSASPDPNQILYSPTPVSQTATLTTTGPNVFHADASAAAGPGYVSGSSRAFFSYEGGHTIIGAGSAQEGSDFSMDNILLIAPDGVAPGTPVQYSTNINLTGSIEATAINGYGARAGVRLRYSTNSFYGGVGNFELANISVDSSGTVVSSGLVNGFPIDGSLGGVSGTTFVWTGRAGDSITIGLLLDTLATMWAADGPSGYLSGAAEAFADFSHTAMFGPTVFNFFDGNGDPLTGWSASSTDGCIANNQYLCSPSAVGDPVTGVPEPMTLSLLGAGLVGIGIARRRSLPSRLRRSDPLRQRLRGESHGFAQASVRGGLGRGLIYGFALPRRH
ncbi:MAG: PEP-CTERM sorting domain-containing protein [Pseudomonadota bacterium]